MIPYPQCSCYSSSNCHATSKQTSCIQKLRKSYHTRPDRLSNRTAEAELPVYGYAQTGCFIGQDDNFLALTSTPRSAARFGLQGASLISAASYPFGSTGTSPGVYLAAATLRVLSSPGKISSASAADASRQLSSQDTFPAGRSAAPFFLAQRSSTGPSKTVSPWQR